MPDTFSLVGRSLTLAEGGEDTGLRTQDAEWDAGREDAEWDAGREDAGWDAGREDAGAGGRCWRMKSGLLAKCLRRG